MIEFLLGLTIGDYLVIIYVSSLVVVAISVIIVASQLLREDFNKRDKYGRAYTPFFTVGMLLKMITTAICPVLNTLSFLFIVIPDVWNWIGYKFKGITDTPLVPPPIKKENSNVN